jgi:hypothetical protein
MAMFEIASIPSAAKAAFIYSILWRGQSHALSKHGLVINLRRS